MKLALRLRSGQAMKQTNPSSALRVTVSLGTLGLNEDFVQMNEIMKIFTEIIYLIIIKSQNYFGK